LKEFRPFKIYFAILVFYFFQPVNFSRGAIIQCGMSAGFKNDKALNFILKGFMEVRRKQFQEIVARVRKLYEYELVTQ